MDASIARIAAYARTLRFEDLTESAVHETTRHFIDTMACALGGYEAEPCRIARRIASRSVIAGGPRILGSAHRTLPELAAFANGVMGRYLDGNDTFPGGGGGHPSDVIAPILAVAESVDADGRALISAIVTAYEVYHAIYRGAVMRKHGLDHVLYTAVGSAVGAGRVFGLDEEKLGHAVSLAITPNLPLHVTRRGDLSMWKGVAAGNAARNGVFAAFLAAEGMTGPQQAVEGSHGLRELVGSFELGDLAPPRGDFKICRSNLKYFLSEYHSQSPITAAIELARELHADEIEAVTIHTYWFARSEIGSEPEKWHPKTRESADHSLPFIIAAVLIDGGFSDEIFSEARIADPAVHALADRIAVVDDPALSASFPATVPCRIEIRTRGGQVKTASVEYPRGHVKNPMSDDEVSAKFRTLAARTLSPEQVEAALAFMWRLQSQRAAGVLDALKRA